MAKFRQKGVRHHRGISPKREFSTFGRVFIPKWQHFAFRKSEKRRKIPPFLLCQTEISLLWAKSPLKDPSRLRSDAKFRQNGVTHGLDFQNRPERHQFRCLAYHAQNGIQPKGELSPKTAQKPSVNSQPSAKFHHPMGPKGVSFPKKRNVSQRHQGESLPNRQQNQTVNSANCPDPKTTRGKGGFHPPLMVSP